MAAGLSGVHAIWQWRRVEASIWSVPIGLTALFVYATVQTYHPETEFGRLYAACAGVFLLAARAWGWAFDVNSLSFESATTRTMMTTTRPFTIPLPFPMLWLFGNQDKQSMTCALNCPAASPS